MASNSSSAQVQEIRELNDRVEWLDEERRKLARRLTEFEQQLALREREVEGREQRIKELESRLSSASAQLSRLSQLDTQLSQFKDEVVQMIEQYDQRRIRSESEIDRLRRMEQEVIAREMADMRKELPAIQRLQNDMQLRVAEESRLAGLISEQQNKISAVKHEIDSRESGISFLEQKESQNSRLISETQSSLQEIGKRWEKSRDTLELMSANVLRVETNQQSIVEEQAKMRQSLQTWMEQIQLGEYERNQRLESWQRILVQHEESMAQFSKEWVAFSDQYKEARMAVQTLSEWQKQVEEQLREGAELLRVEAHRLQSRWDEFRQEDQAKWKNFEIESEQRWSTIQRHEKQVQEQIVALDEWLEKLTQEQDLVRRVQAAQADAVKRLPLLWMEEVEKAAAQNPNRRRQPALVPVREE